MGGWLNGWAGALAGRQAHSRAGGSSTSTQAAPAVMLAEQQAARGAAAAAAAAGTSSVQHQHSTHLLYRAGSQHLGPALLAQRLDALLSELCKGRQDSKSTGLGSWV